MQRDPDAVPVGRMQEAAIEAWFANHWRLPRPSEPAYWTTPVPRRELRRQINVVLVACKLPLLCERSDLWRKWVLFRLLGMDDAAAASGRSVALVAVRAPDALRHTLQALLATLPTRPLVQ